MDLQKLKRLNLRQPKYIFPLVISVSYTHLTLPTICSV